MQIKFDYGQELVAPIQKHFKYQNKRHLGIFKVVKCQNGSKLTKTLCDHSLKVMATTCQNLMEMVCKGHTTAVLIWNHFCQIITLSVSDHQ